MFRQRKYILSVSRFKRPIAFQKALAYPNEITSCLVKIFERKVRKYSFKVCNFAISHENRTLRRNEPAIFGQRRQNAYLFIRQDPPCFCGHFM